MMINKLKIWQIGIISVLMISSFSTFSQESTPNDLIEKGRFLLENNRYDDAILMFNKAAELDPENHIIPYEKANCYLGIGKFKEATIELQKAVKIKDDFKDGYELLGDLFSSQFRNPKKATFYYDKAYQYDNEIEDKLRYKLEIINLLFTYNKHHLALRHIKDAEAIMPNNFDLEFFEAEYYNETEQFDKAIEVLSKIIDEVPEKAGNEKYFFELGRAYHFMGEYEKADVYFKKADGGAFRTKLARFTPEFYFSVAEIYFQVYEYEKAKEYMNITMNMKATFPELFDLQKKLEAVKQNNAKIIEAEKSAIEKETDQEKLADRYFELALYANQGGDFVQAAAACEEYLQLKPRDYKVMFLHSMCLFRLQQYDDASLILSRMLKNPKLPAPVAALFNFGLGLIYEGAEDFDQAEEAFQKAYSGKFKAAAIVELREIFKLRRKQDTETEEETEATEE